MQSGALTKAAVENTVLIVQRWILARLRDQTFFDLGPLNAAVRVLLDELNDRPMKKLGVSRRALYASMDGSKPAICGRLKTGHFRRPETGVEIYFTASSVGKVFAGALAASCEPSRPKPLGSSTASSTDRSRSQTCSSNSAVADPASDSGKASRHSRYCSCNSRSVCTASFHCCGRDLRSAGRRYRIRDSPAFRRSR